MKPLVTILGILLIIFGIAVLGYRGFTYTTEDKVAQIGNVQITAENQKTIYFNPMTGGLAVIAGVILVVVGRRKY